MNEPTEDRQRQQEARHELRRLGIEIDLSDHREPTEIVSAMAAIGIIRTATEPTDDAIQLAKRRPNSPYLAF